MTLNAPLDGHTLRAWTEQFLTPVFRPGDIVIIDNLPSHTVSGICRKITAQGHYWPI